MRRQNYQTNISEGRSDFDQLIAKSLCRFKKHRYELKYTLTYKLNQDALEILFGQLRGRGGLNDHPTPLDAIYSLGMIILGRSSWIQQKNTNLLKGDGSSTDEYLSANVIQATLNIPENNAVLETDSDAVNKFSGSSHAK